MIEATLNGTSATFTYGDSWTSGSNYSLVDDESKFTFESTTPYELTVNISNVRFIYATTHSQYQAKKLTIDNVDRGAFKLQQDADGASASTENTLLQLIDNHFSSEADYHVQWTDAANQAYIYRSGADLSSTPTMTFVRASDATAVNNVIHYHASQLNEDRFASLIDLSGYRDDLTRGSSWQLNADGKSKTVVLTDQGYATDFDTAFEPEDFTVTSEGSILEIYRETGAAFRIDSVNLLSHAIPQETLSTDSFYTTFDYDFSQESVYAGKRWQVTIDGVQYTASAQSGDEGHLPNITDVIQELASKISAAGYTASAKGSDHLEISNLNDVIVEAGVTSTGVGAFFDLDNVEDSKEVVRTYSQETSTLFYSRTVDGSEYRLRTPYISLYEVVPQSQKTDGSSLAAELDPSLQA